MLVRVLSDYRSRAWIARFTADQVVVIDHPELLAELLAEGCVEAIAPVVEAPAVAETPEPRAKAPRRAPAKTGSKKR